MRRREFMALAGAAAAWPMTARARQQGNKHAKIGYLAPDENQRLLAAFKAGLRDLGYLQGHNLTLSYRSADGRREMLAPLAAELVGLSPDVIVTLGSAASHAARNATGRIAIVFAPAGDPVPAGLVQSLARPGANLTGVSINTWVLNGKRLEVLKENFPEIKRVAVLVNGSNPTNLVQWEETKPAGQALSLDLRRIVVNGVTELRSAFVTIAHERVDALVVLPDAAFDAARQQIITLAAELKLPAVYEHRAFVEVGGLMSYGPNLDRVSYRAASFVDKIVQGALPADLPVEQPTTLELLINLKTAKALGLHIQPLLLARADEVIE